MLLRAKNQTAPAFAQLKSNISGFKLAIAGLVGATGLRLLIDNIKEAEQATAQLDAAFIATGKTAGITRRQLDDLASQIQRTTTVSDDLVKQAEAVLLTFTRVRGEAFERTIKVAADLSARMGTDLVTAVRSVGLALQDPERGLIALRRSGVAFSEEQRNLIKTLIDTGQASKAQNIILAELEQRFKGSAAAARNTLGGALTGLKNAFGDLFEGTKESTAGAVGAINSLSGALSDPKIKHGIDTIIAGMSKILELSLKLAAGGANAVSSGRLPLPGPLGFINVPLGLARSFQDRQSFLNDYTRGGGSRRGSARTPSVDTPAPVDITEFKVTLQKMKDEYSDLLSDLENSTRTSVQVQADEYIKLRTTLQFLRDENLISQEEFGKRLGAALDDALPEIDLNEIRSKYQTLKQETTELGEFMKGVWQGVGNSIRQNLSDAIYEGKLSLKSLVDVARRAFADITAALITSGLKKQLAGLLGGAGGGGSSAAFGASFLTALGFAAGGGRVDRPTIVGEDGRELALPGSRIMNQRQMAFAGGAGGITFAPVTTIAIIERENPDQTKREIFERVSIENARQQGEFIRVLQRSGVEVKG